MGELFSIYKLSIPSGNQSFISRIELDVLSRDLSQGACNRRAMCMPISFQLSYKFNLIGNVIFSFSYDWCFKVNVYGLQNI